MSNKNTVTQILGENITVTKGDYLSLTDMLKAIKKDFAYHRVLKAACSAVNFTIVHF